MPEARSRDRQPGSTAHALPAPRRAPRVYLAAPPVAAPQGCSVITACSFPSLAASSAQRVLRGSDPGSGLETPLPRGKEGSVVNQV